MDTVINIFLGLLAILIVVGIISIPEDTYSSRKDLKAYTCIQGIVYEIGKTGNLYIQRDRQGPKRCPF